MSLAFFRRAPAIRPVFPETLDAAGRTVPLVAVRSLRARRLTLRADPATGHIRLTLPPGIPAARGLAFLADQTGWLAARVARWPLPLPIVPDVQLPFADGHLRVVWSSALPRVPQLHGGELLVGGPETALAARVERWLVQRARAVLAADSAGFAAVIGRPPPPVRVADPKGRWGSCSAAGGLAYSWRLIMAPSFVRRAVAAHEVAHLVHHDHGRAFHALAARLAGGDGRSVTRWLAASGAALHWVGRH